LIDFLTLTRESAMDARITLDQWRALLAVIDEGGYARAAEALRKSQSAISYAISQLESQLGIRVFQLQGRRAVPTPAGQLLYRRARLLLEEATALEQAACQLAAGTEAELRLAVDLILPFPQLLPCLASFAERFPDTRLDILESTLSGTEDAILQRQADLTITARVPPGFLGEPLLRIPFVAVSHPEHALQRMGRELTFEDLRLHRQVIVRDSGSGRRRDEGWLGAEQRWTVSHMVSSLATLRAGLGFAWLPRAYVAEDLASGALARLPLREGGERFVQSYLVFGNRDAAGPAALHLAALLHAALGEK
jgi:DNA-binding transcriptional LysR family regulator